MLNRVLKWTPPFTPTRIQRGEGHSFGQLNIMPNITSNYTSLFIKHMSYACINILLDYNIYYIGLYCNSVYILLFNCGMTVRVRMTCSLSCIYCILYYYYNITFLKPKYAHKPKKDVSQYTQSMEHQNVSN